MSLYRHHALYSAFFAPSPDIRGSIDALVARHLAARPRRMLDPACGPSLWLEHFAAAGSEVAGIELDPEVAAAGHERLAPRRRRGREARVVAGDMRSPPAEIRGPFELVVNLDNSIGHLAGVPEVAEHLAAMRRLVAPRGIYLLGLAVRESGDAIEAESVYERGPLPIAGGGFAAVRSETLGLQPPHRRGAPRCERIRHLVLTAGIDGLAPLFLEQYDLLTFPYATLKDILAATGWKAIDCRDATDESLPKRRFGPGAGDVLLVLSPTGTASPPDAPAARAPRAATRSTPRRRARA